jgi:hypothetical protein
MLRFAAGAASAMLLIFAGFFIWKGQAETDSPIPPAPSKANICTLVSASSSACLTHIRAG